MSDGRNETDISSILEAGKGNLQLIYILYLAGVVVGITPLIAVIFAYLNRGKAGGWARSHYTFAIRTFWIGLLFSIISAVLTFVVIGVFGFIATAVWVIARSIVGLQKVSNSQAIDNPQSWLL